MGRLLVTTHHMWGRYVHTSVAHVTFSLHSMVSKGIVMGCDGRRRARAVWYRTLSLLPLQVGGLHGPSNGHRRTAVEGVEV